MSVGLSSTERLRGASTPLVVEITSNSLDDGPGVRSVVFLRGCPLSCVWAHNPETKKVEAELAFDSSKCIECGACLDVCPESAVSLESASRVLRDKCTLCFTCADHCPSGALSRVGVELTVQAIVDEVVKDRAFYEASGGGVTISGGEPTLFTSFLGELLEALKAEGLHTLVETDGLFSFESFRAHALPHTDAIYFYLKIYDDEAHRRHCGTSNRRILENFARLHELRLCGDYPFELLPRTPLIPALTATESNLTEIASFLQRLGVERAQLLPYNPLWRAKMERIGKGDFLIGSEAGTQWMTDRDLEGCEETFTSRGIELVR